MKKLGLVVKNESERILKEKLKLSECFLLIKYSGISASDLNHLRGSLLECGSSMMVIKNSVGKRLFKDKEELTSCIQGPCGLVFINNDLIAAARTIAGFVKEKPNLEVKVGFLKDRLVSNQEIKDLAKIPSLSALHAQVVGGMKSPINGLVFSLKQVLNKLVWALGLIKDKKGG